MKAQYKIFDGINYISIIKSCGVLVRLRNMRNKRYAITYTLEMADKLNKVLNSKGIPSQVIPYVKDWKRNNQSFTFKNQNNEII